MVGTSCWESREGIVGEVGRVEMKRRGKIKTRWKVPKIIFSFFWTPKKKKKKSNQFKIFCTGSKNFVLV